MPEVNKLDGGEAASAPSAASSSFEEDLRSAADHTSDSEFAETDHTGRYGRYIEVLGKGAFKTVYRAFDEVEGIEVAWNQVKIQDLLQKPEDLERMYSEVHLLKSLKHKNIIKFYTSWLDDKNKNVNFITEIFTSGTLRQYRKKHKHVDMKAVKNWARQILRGLLYLHSHDPPIIHRDLKCDNIFVNGNSGEVKIGDLGLATILRQAYAAHSVIGTPEFMAPELYEEEYNELVDIYSFGMCLLELVTFEYPYSECTNAAQIYKKVTSGKKPAALVRVMDTDMRQFIESCLTVASKRLPARELLAHPFLQSDGYREPLECVPRQPQCSKLVAYDMDEYVSKGESHILETRTEILKSLARSLPNAAIGHDCNPSGNPSLSTDDQPRRSRDFRVRGKKRNESTVFLRLHIANSQGHTRYIHFLFDIEGDTAMSVASEMVEELQLSDQDVTTIAEMIDAEILALVPDWKPGASFEDSGLDTVEVDPVDSTADTRSAKDKSEVGDSDAAVDEVCSSTRKICSPSFKMSLGEDASPTRAECMMYGRFEEVPYDHVGSDYSASSSGVPPPVSNFSSENHGYVKPMDHPADPASPDFDLDEVWYPLIKTTNSPRVLIQGEECRMEPVEVVSAAFNDLVESQRNASCSKYTHQTWDIIMNMDAIPDRPGYSELEHDRLADLQPVWACGSNIETPTDFTDGEEDLDRELKLLEIKQEQEVAELHRKHKKAMLEVKSRWERRSGSTVSSKIPSDAKCCDASSSNKHTPSYASTQVVTHGPVLPSLEWESRICTADADRFSPKELTVLASDLSGGMEIQCLVPSLVMAAESLSSMAFHMTANSDLQFVDFGIISDEKILDGGKHPADDVEETSPQDLEVHCPTLYGEKSPCQPLSEPVSPLLEVATKLIDEKDMSEHLTAQYRDSGAQQPVSSSMIVECVLMRGGPALDGEKSPCQPPWEPVSPRLEVPNKLIEEKDLSEYLTAQGLGSGSQQQVIIVDCDSMTRGADQSLLDNPSQLCRIFRSETGKHDSSATEDGEKLLNPAINVEYQHVNVGQSDRIDSTGTQGQSCKVEASIEFEPNYADMPGKKLQKSTERTDQFVQERRSQYTDGNSKNASNIKDKCSVKVDAPMSDASSHQEQLGNPPMCSSPSNDRALELKREQLQRSIAELEAKTLEGLHCLKNGFLATQLSKKSSGGASVQPSSSSGQTSMPQGRSHSASDANRTKD